MQHFKNLTVFLLLGFFCVSQAMADATYYLVRHAEKQKDGTKDPALTAEGEQRAEYLAQHLSRANITKIYSTDYKRTIATAAPLAKQLGLKIEIYDPTDLSGFAKTLKQQVGQILIVGHSNTTPPLAQLLSGEAVAELDESEYDNLYQVVWIDNKTKLTRFKIFPIQPN